MRWLIIILLVSCGKHQQPKGFDFEDNDGDQIQNYQESEFDKNIADFEPLGSVKGVIRFNYNGLVEVSFSNQHDLYQEAMTLLIANENKIESKEYFAEWSRLKLLSTVNLTEEKYKQYNVQIQFESGSDIADEVLFINGKEIRSLGSWNQALAIQLAGENLRSLLEGRSHLALRKRFKQNPLYSNDSDLTIKEKTYQVHYFDGKKTKILYVSKNFSMKNLLEKLNISETFHLSDDLIFYSNQLPETERWYLRELTNGNKVLVLTNKAELKNIFLKKYTYKKSTLVRENGIPTSRLNLNNKLNETVYLRIKSLQYTQRTFNETSQRRNYTRGGGGRDGNAERYSCTHYFRNVSSEQTLYPGYDILFGNMNTDFLASADVIEQINEKGTYWEMKLNGINENLELVLNPRAASTFIQTGEYLNSCGGGRSYPTNTEGKFSFEVESFVEKI